MFTRNSSTEPKSLERRIASATGNGSHYPAGAESGEKSVIGNDLRIIGQGLKIIGKGVRQVDGVVEGDVHAAEVIIGEHGRVAGTVAGQRVIVRGAVSGVICAKAIALQSTSRVEGDIHHMSLAIEQGAEFDGRSRRAATEADLNAVVEKASG
jgi:cytoskeletal protein CcmA (bactofilin family)